jgi:hypothetical protein
MRTGTWCAGSKALSPSRRLVALHSRGKRDLRALLERSRHYCVRGRVSPGDDVIERKVLGGDCARRLLAQVAAEEAAPPVAEMRELELHPCVDGGFRHAASGVATRKGS